ncbi:MAG TPA: SPASM domain-containing protein, partial [Prosthecobacter sp.]|nr:SPASM domain-containing protein [Prosthecobacter sp.]
ENYILGDVFTGLDREKTLGYYRKVNQNATNRCHSCWIRDYCGGGCAWLLSKKDGHLADPTLRECDRRRKSVERALWIRQKLRTHLPERFNRDGEMNLDAWEWGTEALDGENEEAFERRATAGPQSGGCDSEKGGGCENCGSVTGCGN